MDEIYRYTKLLDFYGPLLTLKQQEVMDLHYNSDFTLAEIGQKLGISRQGAYDMIKKSKTILEKYESMLSLLESYEADKAKISEALEILDKAASGQRPATISELVRLKELITGIRSD